MAIGAATGGVSALRTVTTVGLFAKTGFLSAVATRGIYDGVNSSIDAYGDFSAGNYGSGVLNVIGAAGSFFDLGAAFKGLRGLKGLHFPTPVARATDIRHLGPQRLFYDGARQARALEILNESATAARVRLSDYVDDVVFTTGRSPWFSIVNGRRTIALPASTLQKTIAGQLITGVHELSHARHSAKFGFDKYMKLYNGGQRGRIEVLVESRALRTVERYLGELSSQQVADSLRYINSWL